MMKCLTPGSIGSMKLKNRIVMAPLSTNFPSAQGEITPEFSAFYLERAKGGVGLIILEGANVDFPLGKSGYTQLRIDQDRFLPGLYQFVEMIHETGAKLALQLNHAGGMLGDRDRSELTPIAASALVYGKNKRFAREAAVEEIHGIQQKFIAAAERARQCGFDAVELHGANGYLIASFLSPWTNHRTDQYGGSVENRARFACELVAGMRERLGERFPILFRISGDEMVAAGRHLDETAEVVTLLKQAGIACAHVSAGNHRIPQLPARRAHIEPMSCPQGWKSAMAREIRARCDIPVIAVGTIRDVEVAERIANEDADFVAMARQLIADPDWVNKARAGSRIRKCLSCNACVMHRSYYGGKLRCCVNPRAGVEYRTPRPSELAAAHPKAVAVVGGGPAGMQAALTAARRGHRVTLFEKGDRLGGALWAAGGIDLKCKIPWLCEWLAGELDALPVDIRLGTAATAALLERGGYEAVILATGSTPRVSAQAAKYLEGNPTGAGRVIQAADLLSGRQDAPVGAKRAVVLGAGLVGCEAAYKLAKLGLKVELLEGYRTKQNLIANTDQINGNELLFQLGVNRVRIHDHTRVISLDDRAVTACEGEQTVVYPCDVVVLAQGLQSDNTLERELTRLGRQVVTAGDCNAPREIFYAIHEGFTAGMRL